MTYRYIAVLLNGRLPPREAQKSSHISNALLAQSSAAVVGMQCLTHHHRLPLTSAVPQADSVTISTAKEERLWTFLGCIQRPVLGPPFPDR